MKIELEKLNHTKACDVINNLVVDRYIKVKKWGFWRKELFQSLRPGLKYKLFEPDGVQVKYNNKGIFKAVSDVAIVEIENGKFTLMVQSETV